jgi:hypothetical protein
MKKIYFLLLIINILYSCNNNKKASLKEGPSNQEIQKVDTIKLPGGFYIGMNEEDIINLIKRNPKELSIKNKELGRRLYLNVCNEIYALDMTLYNGKLSSATYFSMPKWRDVTDLSLKKHYQSLCGLLKNLNNYYDIKNIYLNQTKAEWPYSFGTENVILLSELKTVKANRSGFLISLARMDDQISINLSYNQGYVEDYQSTLSKSLEFN